MRKLQTGITLFLCISLMCMTSCRKDNQTNPTINPFESQDDGLVETPTENYQIEMLELINEVRALQSNCGGEIIDVAGNLRWDSRLYAAALAHANSMNDKNYFSHSGDDGSTAAQRVAREDYNWSAVGENIAFDFAEAATVNEGFVNSPVHCKVMNNASYKEVGVAKVGKYWVVVFASHL